MKDFLIYDGKVAVALLVFYLFYRFLLKRETFHRFNRVVLVGTTVLSFLLPLCIISFHRPLETGAQALTPAPVPSEAVSQGAMPMAEALTPWWETALTVLFWVGVAVVLARVAVSILSILRIIRRGEVVREEDGCKIIVTERNIDPFSWMKYIVLSRKDWEGDNAPILAHEKAHIGLGHSVEVLLVDILSALQWFNPAIWMLRADLRELHEYEADDAVLRAGTDLREYQYLLIRKAVSKSGYSVANSFNHSILKNRITMMSKDRSPLARRLRVLWLLPLVCLGLGLQAKTVYFAVAGDSWEFLSDQRPDCVLPGIAVVKWVDPSVKPEDIIQVDQGRKIPLTAANNYVTAPVCSEDFGRWLNQRLFYPRDRLYSGTLVARFVVGKDGKLGKIAIVSGLCEEADEMVVKLLGESPAWTPALKDGKPVAAVLFQPILFQVGFSSPAHLRNNN